MQIGRRYATCKEGVLQVASPRPLSIALEFIPMQMVLNLFQCND